MPDSTISPVASQLLIDSTPAVAETRADAAEAESTSRTADFTPIDSSSLTWVTISDEAKSLQAQDQAAKQADPPTWETRFGLRAGEHRLNDGTRQVVTIEGDSLEIMEYDKGGNLLRKIEGSLSKDSAILDTEVYNDSGEVVQTLHVELTGLADNTNASTTARMTRRAEWFEDGEVTRRMQESMELESTYRMLALGDEEDMEDAARANAAGNLTMDSLLEGGMLRAEQSLDDMAGTVTQDSHKSRYFLHVQDYENGHLSQELTVKQKGAFNNLTNRTDQRFGGQEPNTTRELDHDMSLSISLTNYDKDGELLREATFMDSQQNGTKAEDGRLSQSLSVSWYNQGELVRRSHGTLTMDEADGKGMADRPTILQTLGIKNEDYSADRPLAASDLLANVAYDAATQADHFAEPLHHDAAMGVSGAYDTSGGVAKSGSKINPYKIKWISETFVDGELAARQEDKESAIESPVPTGLKMRTGGGLTENENPAVLHRSSHSDASYDEYGRVERQAAIESKEFVKEYRDAPDQVRTFVQGSQGDGGRDDEEVHRTLIGTLEETDGEHHAAAHGFSTQLKAALGTVANTLRDFDRP